jgi:hypothetical protein
VLNIGVGVLAVILCSFAVDPILSIPVGDMGINWQVPKLLAGEEGFEYENNQVLVQICNRHCTD